MDKSFTFILVLSIFLVQCWSQYQYIPKDYKYDQDDELFSITFRDSSKSFFTENKNKFVISSDSLLIVYKPLSQNTSNIDYSSADTLNLNKISYFDILQYDSGKTILCIFFGVAAFLFFGILFLLAKEGININLGGHF